VEPTNLLKTLAEQDTNFEAYLKLAQHQDHPNETESQVSLASVGCKNCMCCRGYGAILKYTRRCEVPVLLLSVHGYIAACARHFDCAPPAVRCRFALLCELHVL
jgi:hypothetical protein